LKRILIDIVKLENAFYSDKILKYKKEIRDRFKNDFGELVA